MSDFSAHLNGAREMNSMRPDFYNLQHIYEENIDVAFGVFSNIVKISGHVPRRNENANKIILAFCLSYYRRIVFRFRLFRVCLV